MKALDSVLKFAKQKSPEILTGLAIAGVVSTIFCVRKASKEEVKIVDAVNDSLNEEDLNEEEEKKLKKAAAIEIAKAYIPSAVSGAITVACIIGARSTSAKREAALTAAYELSREALGAYKEKIKEIAGPKKAEAVKDAVLTEKVVKNPPKENTIIITGCGDYLCLDEISGRYFKSDINKIRTAINTMNERIMSEMWVSINEFYDLLNLPHISIGDDLGYSVDVRMELTPTYCSGEEGSAYEGMPCMVMAFRDNPVPSFRY